MGQAGELDHHLPEGPGTPPDSVRRPWWPPWSVPHRYPLPNLQSHTQLGFSVLSVCRSYLSKAILSRPCFSLNTPTFPPRHTQPSLFYIASRSLTPTPGRPRQ